MCRANDAIFISSLNAARTDWRQQRKQAVQRRRAIDPDRRHEWCTLDDGEADGTASDDDLYATRHRQPIDVAGGRWWQCASDDDSFAGGLVCPRDIDVVAQQPTPRRLNTIKTQQQYVRRVLMRRAGTRRIAYRHEATCRRVWVIHERRTHTITKPSSVGHQ